MLYFDSNATTPLSAPARQAWMQASAEYWGNASAGYRLAATARAALARARASLAAILGVEPDSLVFCSGATEASNLWLRSTLSSLTPGQSLLISELDHACVVETARQLAPNALRGFCPGGGRDIVVQLEQAVRSDPGIAAVAMMAANNVTGECYDWQRAAAWCRDRGLAFFCDATQWMGKVPLQGWDDVDAFCASAHKFGGPKGMGFLKRSRRFARLQGQTGGSHEGGVRAGTEDIPGILAMVAALEHSNALAQDAQAIQTRLGWKQQFQSALAQAIPEVRFHVPADASLWNTVSLSLPEGSAESWIQRLDRRGIAVASGSACSTGSDAASRVLLAMGIEEAAARRTLRFSAAWTTTEVDWDQLLTTLVALWKERGTSDLQRPGQVIPIDDL